MIRTEDMSTDYLRDVIHRFSDLDTSVLKNYPLNINKMIFKFEYKNEDYYFSNKELMLQFVERKLPPEEIKDFKKIIAKGSKESMDFKLGRSNCRIEEIELDTNYFKI